MAEGQGVVAALVAAGAGARFGGVSKAALRLADGRSFACAIVESALAAGLERCVIVARTGAPLPADLERFGDALERVENRRPERSGMLGSIHAALASRAAKGSDAMVLWPIDCPRVGPEVVRVLVDRFRRTGRPLVAPAYRGRRGHPVLFAARLFEPLREAPPDQGARAVVRAYAGERLVVETGSPEVLDDIDTPERLLAIGGSWPTDAGA